MTKIRCLFSMVNWEGRVPKELHLSTGCHACENLWGISHGPARPSVSAMAKPKLCNSSVVLEPASRVRSPSVRPEPDECLNSCLSPEQRRQRGPFEAVWVDISLGCGCLLSLRRDHRGDERRLRQRRACCYHDPGARPGVRQAVLRPPLDKIWGRMEVRGQRVYSRNWNRLSSVSARQRGRCRPSPAVQLDSGSRCAGVLPLRGKQHGGKRRVRQRTHVEHERKGSRSPHRPEILRSALD